MAAKTLLGSAGAAGSMNIGVMRACIAIRIAMGVMVPMTGLASDGTVTFTGTVTENSCTPQVNGVDSGDGTVVLPVVDTTALGQASGQSTTAAGTFFSIELSACALDHPDMSGSAPALVAVYFEAGPNVDPVTHSLINAGTSNVEVTLYEASGETGVGAPITPGAAFSGQSTAGAGTLYFYAGYSLAENVEATAGTVSTSVTYSLVYH